jgi:hypothetical protein
VSRLKLITSFRQSAQFANAAGSEKSLFLYAAIWCGGEYRRQSEMRAKALQNLPDRLGRRMDFRNNPYAIAALHAFQISSKPYLGNGIPAPISWGVS